MCNISFAYSTDLPKLLSSQCPLAIYGNSTRTGGVVRSIRIFRSGSMTLNHSETPFLRMCCKDCRNREKNCRVSTSTMNVVHVCLSKFVYSTSIMLQELRCILCNRGSKRWHHCLDPIV